MMDVEKLFSLAADTSLDALAFASREGNRIKRKTLRLLGFKSEWRCVYEKVFKKIQETGVKEARLHILDMAKQDPLFRSNDKFAYYIRELVKSVVNDEDLMSPDL